MDRTKYQNIRRKLNLAHSQNALFIYWMQNLVLGAASYLASLQNKPIRFVAIPLIATLIFRNFSMMHEAVHRAASKNSQINDWNGVFAGAVCLLPFEAWKKSHLEHHLWSGNIDKDPVMAIIRTFPKMPSALRQSLSLFWRAWFPMLACMQYVVFWALAMGIFLKKPESLRVAISLFSPALLWGVLFTVMPAHSVLEILAPSILLYFLAVEVVNLPHHLQLPQHGGDTKFPIWEQHQIARSCVYPKWFGRLVVLNFNYHIEHHMFPDVPWYHLEKLHREISKDLATAYNTDPYFSWILENKPKPISDVLKSSPFSKNTTNKAA